MQKLSIKDIKPGKLKFKGKFQEKQEKVEQTMQQKQQEKIDRMNFEEFLKNQSQKQEDKIKTFEPKLGAGKIMTSGKTIHGQDTEFRSQVQKDDFILLENRETKEQEERKIATVLSDKSLLIYEAFSKDCISFYPYHFRKQDQIIDAEETLEEQFEKKYITLTKQIKKDPKSELTREQQLDLRRKQKRDKFAWC